jgi:hypothetical protein
VRLLTVAAPGGAAARDAVSPALRAWTKGLDIRLRFLNIGIEERVLDLPPGSAEAAGVAVERDLASFRPDVLLLHGGGDAALGAALAAARAGIPVVRSAAGRRDGAAADAERAADRLAAALLAADAPARDALAAEGLRGEPFSPEAAVQAVLRLPREA